MLQVNLLITRTGPRCSRCGGRGPFRLKASRPNGLDAYCIPCVKAYDKASYLKDPEKAKQRARTWAKANRERRRQIASSWKYTHLNSERARQRKHLYGIDATEVHSLWLAQNKSCAICKCPIDDIGHGGKGQRDGMHVDHCHRTGRVRGLLCAHCNKGIGMLGDDPARLEEAARYLRGGTQ